MHTQHLDAHPLVPAGLVAPTRLLVDHELLLHRQLHKRQPLAQPLLERSLGLVLRVERREDLAHRGHRVVVRPRPRARGRERARQTATARRRQAHAAAAAAAADLGATARRARLLVVAFAVRAARPAVSMARLGRLHVEACRVVQERPVHPPAPIRAQRLLARRVGCLLEQKVLHDTLHLGRLLVRELAPLLVRHRLGMHAHGRSQLLGAPRLAVGRLALMARARRESDSVAQLTRRSRLDRAEERLGRLLPLLPPLPLLPQGQLCLAQRRATPVCRGRRSRRHRLAALLVLARIRLVERRVGKGHCGQGRGRGRGGDGGGMVPLAPAKLCRVRRIRLPGHRLRERLG